ncbi:hypothetical protein BC829DRAFT_388184 [Chytridium lagenaria]|nr:hypothetical protein BC829DRAFT_388184 [Chytridium lagenaria]
MTSQTIGSTTPTEAQSPVPSHTSTHTRLTWHYPNPHRYIQPHPPPQFPPPFKAHLSSSSDQWPIAAIEKPILQRASAASDIPISRDALAQSINLTGGNGFQNNHHIPTKTTLQLSKSNHARPVDHTVARRDRHVTPAQSKYEKAVSSGSSGGFVYVPKRSKKAMKPTGAVPDKGAKTRDMTGSEEVADITAPIFEDMLRDVLAAASSMPATDDTSRGTEAATLIANTDDALKGADVAKASTTVTDNMLGDVSIAAASLFKTGDVLLSDKAVPISIASINYPPSTTNNQQAVLSTQRKQEERHKSWRTEVDKTAFPSLPPMDNLPNLTNHIQHAVTEKDIDLQRSGPDRVAYSSINLSPDSLQSHHADSISKQNDKQESAPLTHVDEAATSFRITNHISPSPTCNQHNTPNLMFHDMVTLAKPSEVVQLPYPSLPIINRSPQTTTQNQHAMKVNYRNSKTHEDRPAGVVQLSTSVHKIYHTPQSIHHNQHAITSNHMYNKPSQVVQLSPSLSTIDHSPYSKKQHAATTARIPNKSHEGQPAGINQHPLALPANRHSAYSTSQRASIAMPTHSHECQPVGTVQSPPQPIVIIDYSPDLSNENPVPPKRKYTKKKDIRPAEGVVPPFFLNQPQSTKNNQTAKSFQRENNIPHPPSPSLPLPKNINWPIEDLLDSFAGSDHILQAIKMTGPPILLHAVGGEDLSDVSSLAGDESDGE